jgi:hypothetical protein
MKLNTAMKAISLLTVILFLASAGQAQPIPPRLPPPAMPPGTIPPAVAPAREPVNYLIRIEWKEPQGNPRFLEVLTTDGSFSLDTIQKNPVKINSNDVPVTLRLSGSLSTISDNEGRLQLFLGRTVPYVTSTYGSGPSAGSSYQQMSVGLQSTFIVTFGKPAVIQNDENGQITALVKRMKN